MKVTTIDRLNVVCIDSIGRGVCAIFDVQDMPKEAAVEIIEDGQSSDKLVIMPRDQFLQVFPSVATFAPLVNTEVVPSGENTTVWLMRQVLELSKLLKGQV